MATIDFQKMMQDDVDRDREWTEKEVAVLKSIQMFLSQLDKDERPIFYRDIAHYFCEHCGTTYLPCPCLNHD